MSDSKPLKKAIDQLLRAYGYQEQLDELDLIKSYESLVGNMFVKHTQKINLKNKILYIKLDSAALKQELSYVKEGLVQKLNKEIGRRVVDKIVVT
jgi:predicted nucleic acid-binding Zn ribbon protein